MYTSDYFIKNLNMIPHAEGGYYKEIYASEEEIPPDVNGDMREVRKLWTSIYFLLKDGEASNFHRLRHMKENNKSMMRYIF